MRFSLQVLTKCGRHTLSLQVQCIYSHWAASGCIHPIKIHTSKRVVGVGREVCLRMSICRACKRGGLWTVARSLLDVERWYHLCCHWRLWELAQFGNLNYIDTGIWFSYWSFLYISQRKMYSMYTAVRYFIPWPQETTEKICWHDDVIKWKHFPRYWPFVRGIHHTKASDAELWCLLWSAPG